ncbi:FAD:protein FMN transferase [soil metagenome]
MFLACSLYYPANAQYRKFSFTQPKMGSPFHIVMYAEDSLQAAKAAASAFLLVDTLNEIFSDYLPESELNRLCKTAGSGVWVNVSEPLFDILKKSVDAGKKSNGTFDITISPLVRLWRKARAGEILPSQTAIDSAMNKTGIYLIMLDKKSTSVRLAKKGMQLDLGGIAKGEVAQRVCDRLVSLGFPYVLADAGGDLVAGDVPKGVNGWHVGINQPGSEEIMNQRLLVKNKAVATSGDLYQFVEIDGKRYSHVIDPSTGIALTSSRNVTVIAPYGYQADWLTKACSILPIKKALKMARKMKGINVQIAVLENGVPHYFRSKHFDDYFEK